MLFKQLRSATLLLLLMMVITGIGYPLLVTGIGKILFPYQASGSLIKKDNLILGSKLIGRKFVAKEYFHPRPSAAGNGYDALKSGASNLSPNNQDLLDAIKIRYDALHAENPNMEVPNDLLTASASGLDPHISVNAALFQAPRIVKERKVTEEVVLTLIEQNTIKPFLGIFGDSGVNVLELNIQLDEQAPLIHK